MWICFNDGFISVVAHEGRPDELLVRGRKREILEELFPSIPVIVGAGSDYLYGSEANPLPAAKADLGLLFDFQHGKKSSMYHSGYVSGFFPH